MGGVKRICPEGGSGGKLGHSRMAHWAKTAEVKDGARKARRILDAELVHQGLLESPSSPELNIAIHVRGARGTGQDRAGAFELDGGHILVLADGAGGTAGGAEAADYVVNAIGELETIDGNWVNFLRALDARIANAREAGETTAVVVAIRAGQVLGASVGDSGAWLLDEGRISDLTEQQSRKPLLGSGSAQPVAFGPVPFRGVLLLGSDGLFKYVDPSTILQLSMLAPVGAASDSLVRAAQLPGGSFQDDVSVIVAR